MRLIMNVLLPKQYRVSKIDIIIYTVVIIICVVAITLIITNQFLGDGIFHANKVQIATEEEMLKLRTEFDNMFENKFIGEVEGISKKDKEKDYVFTQYENKESMEGMYTFDVNIPEFNIQDENLDKINLEISQKYKQRVAELLNDSKTKTLYTLQYISYVENDILFLIIRSNLKEGTHAQQTSIDTFQYDLKARKEINLEELLEDLQYDKEQVQEKNNQEIVKQEENSKNLQELGYGIYVRDSKSDIYKIENSNQFFIKNGKLYIVYSYGNDFLTSEMDFVIL